jgi:hypothetical protein
VKRSEDPRDYKVSFERIRSELGVEPKERVPDGIREIIAALAAREFGDPRPPTSATEHCPRADPGLFSRRR